MKITLQQLIENEQDPEEHVSKEQRLIALGKKGTLNLGHFRKILDQTPMSPNDRRYRESVIDSVEKRGGIPTERQAAILVKIKEG